MNATNLARIAYSSPSAPVRSERAVELDAFSRITERLSTRHSKADFKDHILALHENRKLWTLLAIDVADGNNGLPQDLRARIFYLAEFSLAHTSRVLAGDAPPDALVEINRAVMAGLRQQESDG